MSNSFLHFHNLFCNYLIATLTNSKKLSIYFKKTFFLTINHILNPLKYGNKPNRLIIMDDSLIRIQDGILVLKTI